MRKLGRNIEGRENILLVLVQSRTSIGKKELV